MIGNAKQTICSCCIEVHSHLQEICSQLKLAHEHLKLISWLKNCHLCCKCMISTTSFPC